VTLAMPLHMGKALEMLVSIEFTEALGALKRLVENADGVESPLSWLRTECKGKKGKGKGKEGKGKKGKSKDDFKGKGSAKGVKGKGKGKADKGESSAVSRQPLTASERKIVRTLAFINKNAGLAYEIDYREVKPSLDTLDEKNQLAVLERLRKHADTINNPSAWLISEIKKRASSWDSWQQKRQWEWEGEDGAPAPKRAKGSKKGKGDAKGKGKGKGKSKGKGKKGAKGKKADSQEVEGDGEAIEGDDQETEHAEDGGDFEAAEAEQFGEGEEREAEEGGVGESADGGEVHDTQAEEEFPWET